MFLPDSTSIAEEMFGSKPVAYMRGPVSSGAPKSFNPAATPEAVIGNSMLMHQAMVKVVRGGGINAKGGLAKQVAYIGRKGKLEVEQGRGDEGRALMDDPSDVIKDWEADFARADPRMTFFTYHLIVSYPGETDDAASRIAADSFAAKLAGGDYGDTYKYMIAHHRDTKNPHAHVIINRMGEAGKTLQINRHSISADDLRQLHVETSREVGINLNATSRFSRGIDRRSIALGRLKAEQEGRGLPRALEPKRHDEFPFYGAGHRINLDDTVLEDAKQANIRNYEAVAGSLRPIARKVNLPVVDMIGHSINALKQGKMLIRSEQMAKDINQQQREDQNPEQLDKAIKTDGYVAGSVEPDANREASGPQNPREVIGAINEDMRVFFEGMINKVEKIPEEDRRSEAEGALSRALQQYQPLMDEDNRSRFGKFFVEEDRSAREQSAAYQRSEAVNDIRDNRTDDLGANRSQSTEREAAGQARLSKADQDVVERFAKIGFSGDLAMDRIRQGTTVDRETRQQWFDRDVKTHANTNSLSEKQARTDLVAAYGDATGIYKDARKDIRNINRADIGQSRAEQPVQERVNPVEQTERQSSRTTQAPAPNVRAEDQQQERSQDGKQFSVSGVIKEIGEKLYRSDDPESSSPYVTLTQDNGKDRDVWGIAMPDVVERYRLKEGDRATLTNIGNETVEVKQTDPTTGEQKTISAERRAWEASNIERAARTDRQEDRADKRNDRDDDRGVSR